MATLFMIFPEGKRKAFTMSYDDGVESDLRLIDIMRANGLKGTFNINAGLYAPQRTTYPAGTVHRRMTRSQIDAAYDGMEVAVHGYSHPCLERMPLGALVEEVIGDRRALETQFDTIIRGMALPFGCRGGLCAAGGLAAARPHLPPQRSGPAGADEALSGGRPPHGGLAARPVDVLPVGPQL